MKHKRINFFQVSNRPFRSKRGPGEINSLSLIAKWLWITLTQLEHRFTNEGPKKKTDWFFRSEKELAADSGLSVRAITNAKRELKEKGWIKTWPMHWVDPETKKKSTQHITGFTLLK
jgi:hypothetical protein